MPHPLASYPYSIRSLRLGGEASLHLKERGFGRSGVSLLCVGLKLGLALLIDAE